MTSSMIPPSPSPGFLSQSPRHIYPSPGSATSSSSFHSLRGMDLSSGTSTNENDPFVLSSFVSAIRRSTCGNEGRRGAERNLAMASERRFAPGLSRSAFLSSSGS